MNTEKRIEEVLDQEIRPLLHRHGGEIAFIGLQEHTACLELKGACAGCASADTATKDMILAILCQKIPEIKQIELTRSVHPDLCTIAQKILRHETPVFQKRSK